MTIVPIRESLAESLWRNDPRREDAMRKANTHYPAYDFSNPHKNWKPGQPGPRMKVNGYALVFGVVAVAFTVSLVLS